jgi:hypothetical protein
MKESLRLKSKDTVQGKVRAKEERIAEKDRKLDRKQRVWELGESSQRVKQMRRNEGKKDEG